MVASTFEIPNFGRLPCTSTCIFVVVGKYIHYVTPARGRSPQGLPSEQWEMGNGHPDGQKVR